MLNFGFKFARLGNLNYPPVSDELLIWLKGISTDTQKTDSWSKPDAENFDIKQSNCISLNGTDEYGTLDTAITLVGDFSITLTYNAEYNGTSSRRFVEGTGSYVRIQAGVSIAVSIGGAFYGSSVDAIYGSDTQISVSRVSDQLTITNGIETDINTVILDDFVISTIGTITSSITGKLYNLTLKDSTQEHHFRIAEGNESAYSWSDDGTRYITWTGSLDEMWAQRQDTYHGNCVDGFGKGENLTIDTAILNPEWVYSSGVLSEDGLIEGYQAYKVDIGTGGLSYHRLSTINQPTWGLDTTYHVSFLLKFNTDMILNFRGNSNADDGVVVITTSASSCVATDGVNCVFSDASFTLLSDGIASVEFSLTRRNISIAGTTYGVGNKVAGESEFWLAKYHITINQGDFIETSGYTFDGTEYLPFLNTNPGGTWNDCESAFGPESFPVGTFNGTDDYILLDEGWFIAGDFVMKAQVIVDSLLTDNPIFGSVTTDHEIGINATTGEIATRIDGTSGSSGLFVSVGEISNIEVERIGTNVFVTLNGVMSGAIGTSGSDYRVSYVGRGWYSDYSTGIIRDANINGTLLPINEGEGTAIHTPSYGDLDKENLIEWSENVSESPWGASNVTVNTPTTFTFTALFSRVFQEITTQDGELYTLKINIRAVTGNTDFNLRHEGSASGTSVNFTVTNILDEYTFTFLGTVGGGIVKIVLQDNNSSGWGQVEVTSWHITSDDGAPYIKTEDYTYKLGHGRSIGTLSTSDADSFWNDSEPMVSQEVMDMEANGRGAESIEDGTFINDGDSWSESGTDANNTIVFSDLSVTLDGDGSAFLNLTQPDVFEVGEEYEVSLKATGVTGAGWKVQDDVTNENIFAVTSDGTYNTTFTSNGTGFLIGRRTSGQASQGTFTDISARKVKSNTFLTDGLGHPLYLTQDGFDELGEELVENGEFIYWTDPTVPDGFTQLGVPDATNYVEENDNGMRIVSDGTYIGVSTPTEVGKTYTVKVIVDSYSVGGTTELNSFTVQDGSYSTITDAQIVGAGIYETTYTAQATELRVKRANQAVDGVVSFVSLREVNPTMNNNDQYFRKDCVGSNTEYFFYKQVLVGDNLTAVKAACCLT